MDLSRYDRKKVRIRTEDGKIFAGRADVYPSGYGLSEFNRAEESIRIKDTYIFLTDIKTIHVVPEKIMPADDPDRYDFLIDYLLNEVPYWIADILPKQVPKDADGQYFAVDRYFRQPERLGRIHRKMAEVLLKLNCYYDMEYSFDDCKTWELNPDPEKLVERLVGLSGNYWMRALLPSQQALIDIDSVDTYMMICVENDETRDLIRQIAEAEGFFFWQPPQEA